MSKIIVRIKSQKKYEKLDADLVHETTKEAWDVLATTYANDKQTKKVRLMALRRQLGFAKLKENGNGAWKSGTVFMKG